MNERFDIRYFAAGFLVLAVALRLVPHAYNLAAIGALGMFIGCYWSARMGIVMSIAAMAVSDVLGNWLGIASMGSYQTWLMLVVYGATASSAGVGKVIHTAHDRFRAPMLAAVPLGAVAATAIFFLVTNFASWLDPQMGYAPNAAGLLECYGAALPFVKNTLLGNVIYSALFFGVYSCLALPAKSQMPSKAEKLS